jgi:hypothetical protein
MAVSGCGANQVQPGNEAGNVFLVDSRSEGLAPRDPEIIEREDQVIRT